MIFGSLDLLSAVSAAGNAPRSNFSRDHAFISAVKCGRSTILPVERGSAAEADARSVNTRTAGGDS